ncbi:hypothetical protein ACIBF6_01985 [Streptosporangium amethystogenes]|uniref:hypothetical protein n=1 Tax=Streptosporangium amethystogenes TaxID=2002 RepID=UPI0037B4FE0A
MEVLSEQEWRGRASAHRDRVGAWIEPHLRRGQERVAHPVEDFLFTYYTFRPGRLLRWHPGAEVILAGASSFGANYRDGEQGAVLDLELVLPQRTAAIGWTRELLAATASRPPYLGYSGTYQRWKVSKRYETNNGGRNQ